MASGEGIEPNRIASFLQAQGIPCKSIRAEGARADQAARSLGVAPRAVIKSLLFLADNRPVMVLVAGDRRADPQKLRQVLGAQRVMIAPPERVIEETGYPPGAVPPVGHASPLPVWVDAALADCPTVYISGGAPDVMVALAFEDLLRATDGHVADISVV